MRYVGIDIGAETVKLVELRQDGDRLRWTRRQLFEHQKAPEQALVEALSDWDWSTVKAAAVCGRLSRSLALPRLPAQQALGRGFRFLAGDEPATIVSIGAHGFSVLERRPGGTEVFRENSRCSQGTGNFLRQLVERFDLGIEEASALVASVDKPAPLSGRCPVILKTDMTHLANKGEDRARILAGLFDAVCENVQALVKPAVSPPTLVLAGGVCQAPRVQAAFRAFAQAHQMALSPLTSGDTVFLEALGAAMAAAERPLRCPPLSALATQAPAAEFERLPALAAHAGRVRRLAARPLLDPGEPQRLVLGLDIGSTGSKAVAVDVGTREVAWEGYLRTNGNPVGAAQALVSSFLTGPHGKTPVVAVGATGSGREIVGSLLSVCYGAEPVYVLNEIAAHAQGARHFDTRVDTIFEIGGQDAKYIRLVDGRVVDSAMNEACSAGTGSFIEEQGRRFSGVKDVAQLATEALSAEASVSLGQHCSVFMAEIVDGAVAAGVEREAIIAGIHESVIQNYLNRVKGPRSVGSVIFCQGMPFASDALAAAVARQTGCEVVIPPNPGTVGALGIALLALEEGAQPEKPLDLRAFLAARVEKKETFVCQSTQGCGEPGNKCRIDRINTVVEDERRRFTWGGGCSLYDKGTRRKKLPDLAPDPFRERQQWVDALVARVSVRRGGPTIAMTEEFNLKGLFPFFATFLHELGADLVVRTGADRACLKRGIEGANVPFCAPMQLFHGVVSELAEGRPQFLFLPMLRSLPKAAAEPNSTVCPLVQGSADLLASDLGATCTSKVLSPVFDMGDRDLDSEAFRRECARLASHLGLEAGWEAAHCRAVQAQRTFVSTCLDAGRRALAFCAQEGLTPVVVLGRDYTLHNSILNSNVPTLLREQGAVAVPVDCYPVEGDVPVFFDLFWAHSQRNVRAAHQIRRTPGLYSIFCSNYSCGPDSFTIHFFGDVMAGKPFAIIETDGHSGDAGTKTRVEAFLHCVRADQAGPAQTKPTEFARLERNDANFESMRRRQERVLIPRMGPGAEIVAACLRGAGVEAEALPTPDHEAVALGRRYTSGKECLPMTLTLGSLLQRLARDRDSHERFAFFMPRSRGPCRFGAYHLLHKLVLERLGWANRVSVWSPSEAGYFDGVPAGFSALMFASLATADVLLEGLYDARPIEKERGQAQAIYERARKRLLDLAEDSASGDLSLPAVLHEVTSERLFGLTALLDEAGAAFAEARSARNVPTVLVVGEIYVRCDPFASDFIVDRLEKRGLRCRLAPFTEWLEYCDHINARNGKRGLGELLSSHVQRNIHRSCYQRMAHPLGWHVRTTTEASLAAARPYLRDELEVESVLTLGGPVHEWREGLIDAVVSVGPLECMPNKIAESQFFHVAEQEKLLSLTLSLNGDPVDPETLDNFACEAHERFRRRCARRPHGDHPQVSSQPSAGAPSEPQSPEASQLPLQRGNAKPSTSTASQAFLPQ